uniref:Uncharacterized protein n=1 Tax=Syphacia muris TaxID=451379 RepID=A0A0N5AKN4_9BILA
MYRGHIPESIIEQESTSAEMIDVASQQQPLQPRRSSNRMGRRFTLNPLIFAKEERDARRQSLAQLKLSYYPQNAHRKFFFHP